MAVVNRHISLPVAVTMLIVALVGTTLVVLMVDSVDPLPAPPAPDVAPFEPSADNVNTGVASRLHALRQRIVADPGDTTALLELARTLHDGHQPAEAAVIYSRYLESNPENSEVWYDLADSHGRAGDWAAAGRAMQSLLERVPGDGKALFNMGVTEIRLGNTTAARDWLEQAIAVADSATASRARNALAQLDRGG